MPSSVLKNAEVAAETSFDRGEPRLFKISAQIDSSVASLLAVNCILNYFVLETESEFVILEPGMPFAIDPINVVCESGSFFKLVTPRSFFDINIKTIIPTNVKMIPKAKDESIE